MDEWKSPFALWAEKTGRVPPFGGNLTTKVGGYLEDLVAKLYEEETGKTVRRKNATLVNDAYPFACANLDRVVVGESALLEIKTTNSFPVMRTLRGGEFPDRWLCQMTHYLAVTGMERAYLAVLVACREFVTFTLERNEEEIDALMDAERRFWALVETDTAPGLDGSESTSEAVKAMWPDAREETKDLGRFIAVEFEELARFKAERKLMDERISTAENRIKAAMGDAEAATCGRWKATWKTQTRRTFQPKEFAAAHRGLDMAPWYKETTSRVFRVSENKED